MISGMVFMESMFSSNFPMSLPRKLERQLRWLWAPMEVWYIPVTVAERIAEHTPAVV